MQFSQILSQTSVALLGLLSVANAAAISMREDDNVLVRRDCTLTPCKGYGKTQCVGAVYSDDTCINLISSDGRPFISGFTANGCTCKIYSNLDCDGDSVTVDTSGYSRFPFSAASMEC